MAGEEWTTAAHANRYLAMADEVPHRVEGEGVLAEQVPRDARRVLDLGTGDGRLLALLQVDRPQMRGVGLDFSELMLDAAGKRFAGDKRIELVKHDLAEPLPALGRLMSSSRQWPSTILSTSASARCTARSSRCSNPAECSRTSNMSRPQPIACTWRSSRRSTSRSSNEDPSDRLLDVETQLRWLREHGFDDVDCYWKWLEMALLVGIKPDDLR